MISFPLRLSFILVCGIFLSASAENRTVQVSEGGKLLWQIGVSDNDNSEFFLSPNRFSQFDRPGIHVVGLTDPSVSWPYILPGELDTWAGSIPQPFEILFYLGRVDNRGECKLVLDFLDTHSSFPPRLTVRINDHTLEHQTGKGNNDWLMAAEGGSGKECVVEFQVPAGALNQGENRIEITVAKGSWALWDAIRFYAPDGVKSADPEETTIIRSVRQKQLLAGKEGDLHMPLELEILHTGKPTNADIRVSGNKLAEQRLLPGIGIKEIWIPETDGIQQVTIEVFSGENLLARSTKIVSPVRRWEVHLIHQTHLDIGFTHTQEEVLEMQTGYLNQVLDLIDQTREYPEEARFRWHPEGMWAIDEFLRRATPEKQQQFIEAVRDQSIHLDAFYVHLLSGLATGEELLELMQPAKEFERRFGVTVKTAIGSDIPGYSWGIVPAMAAQGIRFFNMAPNNNHRLGRLYHWADKPFYWEGPDARSKVLTWMASHAYIYFWGQDEGLFRVPRFLDYLKNSGFPYEVAMLRYEVGGDNGYPDPGLPDMVKEWNDTFASPKIILSTNSRLYDTFTDRYESMIPVVRGDLTPYWEDGATSTSADLALSREAGERLLQALTLQAMIDPAGGDPGKVSEAWNNIIMYDEHTWGAYCSISEPFAPFTVSQEKYKQRFALEAERLSSELLDQAFRRIEFKGSGVFTVFNTSSWDRSDMVTLTREQSGETDQVVDELGNRVVSQRLNSGELAFWAADVPAFGKRCYRLTNGSSAPASGISISESGISNQLVSIRINSETGAIESIRMESSGRELVDGSGSLLNEFIYMEGRESGRNLSGIDPPVNIFIEDKGPLLGSLRIESGAPGCHKLIRLVRLTRGSAKIDIINIVDKQQVLEPEGIYFAFPLHVPGGNARIDIPWGIVRPEDDQLPGANRNYFPVQRWMDISNDQYGVTWVTPDAPMIAFHPVRIAGKGRGDSQLMAEFHHDGIREWWSESIRPGQSFYSWVMSNHWEVNYKAYQEGPVTFRYALIPHEGGYDGVEAEKLGREICQPLEVVESACESIPPNLPFSFSSDRIIATSLKPAREGDGYMLRLYNPSASRGEATIFTRDSEPVQILQCDPSGIPTRSVGNRIELPGFGFSTYTIR